MALSRRRTISNSTPGPFFLGSTMRISLTALKSSPQQQQQQTLCCEPAKQYYIHIYVCSSSKRGGLRISHVHKIGCLSLLESLQNRTKEATQKSSACGLPSLPPTISPLSILVVCSSSSSYIVLESVWKKILYSNCNFDYDFSILKGRTLHRREQKKSR